MILEVDHFKGGHVIWGACSVSVRPRKSELLGSASSVDVTRDEGPQAGPGQQEQGQLRV